MNLMRKNSKWSSFKYKVYSFVSTSNSNNNNKKTSKAAWVIFTCIGFTRRHLTKTKFRYKKKTQNKRIHTCRTDKNLNQMSHVIVASISFVVPLYVCDWQEWMLYNEKYEPENATLIATIPTKPFTFTFDTMISNDERDLIAIVDTK